MSIIQLLNSCNKIFERVFVDGIVFEGITGSTAYGCQLENGSDTDLVAITIPPIEYVFPTTAGHIPYFGKHPPKFETSQQHHIQFNDKEYDAALYSLVTFFQLASESNPNVLELLFLPKRCILFTDSIGKMIVNNRHLFLSKHSKHKYAGYSHSQLRKMKAQNIKPSRQELVNAHGFDVKHGSHVVRLSLQAEQILTTHDLVLDANGELLKSIRRGEWTFEQIQQWSTIQEAKLESLYESSTLQHSVDYDKLKNLLLNCLEEKFGSLQHIIKR